MKPASDAIGDGLDHGTVISFQREGGFAGIPATARADTNECSVDEARILEELVDESEFFSLPAEIGAAQPSPDGFVYTVTVTQRGRSHTVRTAESDAPAVLRQLLRRLTKLARRGEREVGGK